jgi:hypothetical protein
MFFKRDIFLTKLSVSDDVFGVDTEDDGEIDSLSEFLKNLSFAIWDIAR